ncbi:thioredoxin [Geoglobus ahangari]|uniref:Thioredoxin n=1 Tax=Geoglobus ahangari TaxID=113653 RepID=A0A0F7IFF5_9EURY|nr:thioredoxin [Geoglobus ahangari]AKG91155.1 thioredoxin [Geoglobus ahangari]
MDELEKIRQKRMMELMQKLGGQGEQPKQEVIDHPIKVDASNFDDVLAKHKNIVVDFWAEWCMPCRMIAPIVEQLAKEYAGKVVFAKLNTDENPMIAGRYGITGIPTLIFFKNGRPVDKVVGALPKAELKRWVERNL